MAAALKNRADRYEYGRALRARSPREAHAELQGSRDRDPVAILAESDAERVPALSAGALQAHDGGPVRRFCAARRP